MPLPDTPALRAVRGRIFDLRQARGVKVPEFLDGSDIGLALLGPTGVKKLAKLPVSVPVVLDLAVCAKRVATATEPLDLPLREDLVGPDVYFDGVRAVGAEGAFIPAGYVRDGDVPALMALAEASAGVGRDDVVTTVPVDVRWLRDESVGVLIEVIRAVGGPVAVLVGGQFNPTDAHTRAVANLRRLWSECPNAGLWRVDALLALDAMAHGALFAGVGASGGLRHLVPPDEPARNGGGRVVPTAFLPSLLGYVRSDVLAKRWAQAGALTCACRVCVGQKLDRFASGAKGMDEEASRHNLACWLDLWERQRAAPDAAAWLAERVGAAMSAHETENERISAYGAFKPRATLATMARLGPARTPVR